MTATTVPTASFDTDTDITETAGTTAVRRPLLRAGARSGVIAAVATTVMAAVARAADVDLAIAGEEIPLAGFAQMTLLWTAVGVGIAAACRRFAAAPRRAWARATVALTAISLVPDFTADTDGASMVALALTHVVAAAIVIPAIAARLPEHRTA